MPKVLLYKNIWIFIFYDTDFYENRMHVHIGKKNMVKLCKIWLEPNIEVSKEGELTAKELKEVQAIAKKYLIEIKEQWDKFKKGEKVETIKIK
jgi:hypothetical protein